VPGAAVRFAKTMGTEGFVNLTPAVSEKRLALTAKGKVRYQLKTPYRDGTTHVI